MKLELDVHPKLFRLLRALPEKGYYGATVEEAGIRLIEQGLREMVRDEDKRLTLGRGNRGPGRKGHRGIVR